MEAAIATVVAPTNVTPVSGMPMPDAAKYEQPAAPTADQLNTAFDNRMIDRMKAAHNWAMWGETLVILLKAKENKNLRPEPREFFFDHCPHKVMVESLRKETGCLASKKNPPATDNGERARAEARRKANRETRLAAQPRPGSNAEIPLHPQGGKGKGKGGNKKK